MKAQHSKTNTDNKGQLYIIQKKSSTTIPPKSQSAQLLEIANLVKKTANPTKIIEPPIQTTVKPLSNQLALSIQWKIKHQLQK